MTTPLTTVAIRVLTAINNRMTPDPNDVELLRVSFPNHPDFEPDELACFVIQEAMARKLAARRDSKYRTADR